MWAIVWGSGARRALDVEHIRAVVDRAGAAGIVVYAALFAAGLLIGVPGTAFVAAGVLAFGRAAGFAAGMGGGLLAVTLSFVVVRAAGGTPLASLERPRLRRWIAQVEARPVLAVFVLRALFFLAPPLNYALALSGVRFRHHLAGSALGLVPQMLGYTILFDWAIGRLGQ